MLVISCLEPIRPWLCVALLGLEGSPIGLIQLFSLAIRADPVALHRWQEARPCLQDDAVVDLPPFIPLKPDDLERLAGLTQSLGLAMEFHQVEQQAENEACRQIQATLNHAASPELPGYDFDGLFVPGREFGGSFREFIPRATDRAGGETPPAGTIVMGEVAGKGIRTALIMADVQLEIRRLLLAGLELPDVLSRVNWLLADAGGEGNRVRRGSGRSRFPGSPGNFWSMPDTIRWWYVAASGLIENFDRQQEAIGPPLGTSPSPVYRKITASLAPGDWVFLASNASTRDLIYSWRYFGFEGYRGTETPGAAMISSLRQRPLKIPL